MGDFLAFSMFSPLFLVFPELFFVGDAADQAVEPLVEFGAISNPTALVSILTGLDDLG